MARGHQKIQSQQKAAEKQAKLKKQQGHNANDQRKAAAAALKAVCTVCKVRHGQGERKVNRVGGLCAVCSLIHSDLFGQRVPQFMYWVWYCWIIYCANLFNFPWFALYWSCRKDLGMT